MNKFLKSIIEYFTVDKIEESWSLRHKNCIKIIFEFDNGQKQRLDGNNANEWWHDLHRRNCGCSVDWKRHKWNYE